MAIANNYAGQYLTAAATVHTGSGRIIGYIISHAEATTQTVTFYDNTAASGTVAHQVKVHPNRSPIHIEIARNIDESKRLGIPFTTGLHIDPGNCEVAVWAIGY